MSTTLSFSKVLNIILLMLLIVMAGAYFWLQSVSPGEESSVSVHNPPPSPNHAKHDRVSSASTAKDTPPIPITEEEKSIVAQKQQLQQVIAASDSNVEKLNAESKQLFEQDQQAKQTISQLDAQVKEKTKGLTQ